jgi:hypothetical protein
VASDEQDVEWSRFVTQGFVENEFLHGQRRLVSGG